MTLNLFGQNSDIENLINQIAKSEVPENFDYYYLVPKSLEQPKIFDSIQNIQILKLKIKDHNFPTNLLYKEFNETTDWKDYDLQNVRFVSSDYINLISPPSKNVRFVKYNIEPQKYECIVKNKKPHTLIVKKKLFWNKNRIWENKKFYNELVNAWKIDMKMNMEEKIFFLFSKPFFFENNKYARITIWINRRCNGNGFTALYWNNNGTWEKLIEYNQIAIKNNGTHSKCEEISITHYE